MNDNNNNNAALATATGTVQTLENNNNNSSSEQTTGENNNNNKNNTSNHIAYHYQSKLHHLLLVALLICLSSVTSWPQTVQARRHAPLMFEEADTARRSNRPAVTECQFGKVLRELGSTWYADLGPPFGVMYCIKCECVAIPKKRRIVARVQCRNIKNECPPAKCDDPISLPGKCCKTCPGDRNDTDVALDVPVPSEEEERNMKHYAALLTGRTSYFLKGEEMKSMYTTYNPQNVVATARFLFHKKNLYYSFYTSAKIGRPRAIQFVDDGGVILEEHQLETTLSGTLSVYQNATGKICGVWRRVPRDYKRILRDDRLHVVLLWGNKHQAELALAGKIAKYTALQTELFSSLLEPPLTASGKPDPQLAGAGGTAIVSTSSGAASSMHLTLVFNGVFGVEEFADAALNVRIELPERKELIFDELPRVRKPSAEINVLELSSPITIQNLRLMSRGKLLLTVESKKYPQLRIQGHIVTRASCEIFQTLLAPPHGNELSTRSSGLAWVYLNTDGSLAYNIETDHVNTRDRPNISLIEEQGKRKAKLEDLTPSFNFNQAIGSVEKLGPKVLESLYAGELGVNVATEHEASLIRGRLVPRPVADARDSAEPILLKQHGEGATGAMAMAWMSIDNECNLHYELTLSGINTAQDLQLYLEEKPIEAIGAPVTRKLLEEFTGNYMEGFVLGMPSAELIKLETSVCYLELHTKHTHQLLLRGKLKSTKVPAHCFPIYTDNNVPVPGDHNDNQMLNGGETKCFHSGRFYNESEQWRSAQDTCHMCACQRGQANCELIKCPALKCKAATEQLLQRDGECCPTCVARRETAADWHATTPDGASSSSSSSSPALNASDLLLQPRRGCRLGDQFHAAGASWHPFLPPNGFDTCTTCSCDAATLEVRCPRMVCPPLQCSEKLAYRPDKKACCKVCPEGKQSNHGSKHTPSNPNVLHDQAMQRSAAHSAEETLAAGGCKVVNKIYENGQEWHPILLSHGEQKCIKCRCKDSKVNCDRKRCSRSTCQQTRVSNKRRVFDKPGSELAAPPIDECCSTQCRRSRRHHKRQPHHQQRATSS
ncbi:dorsal-ventral patterning protein Sog [Drosophila sulfurigaster albostrigata]|uniref:dorsal-ventral patterning protein Sog n=1 Tax=Drosophila sulfurigaster albostrigata TaxID=89887 RepID=UPI002D21D3FC|nr:dorsal-ventral patterning protein Sog [Drosophila sulfurigaster albostrigata]XP_062138774.1 dorsal-ventral patterning protein Sog [Drosophila sulfurigaster albostrigata]XP_062138775.1 dorsal-ventral patterning protein Sog [Drosophila sulfurigaster albostrigata]